MTGSRQAKARRFFTATADSERAVDGVAVVASYRTRPYTDRPFRVRGVWETAAVVNHVTIALTEDEARKLVADFASFAATMLPEPRAAGSPSKARHHAGQT